MPNSPSTSPPSKRFKLEDSEHEDEEGLASPVAVEGQDEDSDTNCSICLQPMEDRTVIPTCSHEFCFDCLMIWTAQSRRCPLCTQAIGDYVIHDIRSRFDYRKHHLTPLRSNSPQLLLPPQTTAAVEARNVARRRRRDRERERERREILNERDRLELSIATRRRIYKHDLYAKHVASNSFTKYRPYPTPAQFAASPDLVSRTTTFIRRELQVWQGLDIEFLTNLIISLMKAIDIRSESAVKLLAEFLDMDNEPEQRRVNAEHFAHEVYSYVRSPYRDLFVYDSVVQYDRPPHISLPPSIQRQGVSEGSSSRRRGDSREKRKWRSPSKSPRLTDCSSPQTESLGEFSARNEPEASGSQVPRNIDSMSFQQNETVSATVSSRPSKNSFKEGINIQGYSQTLQAAYNDTIPPRTRKGKKKELTPQIPKTAERIDQSAVLRPPDDHMLVGLGPRSPMNDCSADSGTSNSMTPQSSRLGDDSGRRNADEHETTYTILPNQSQSLRISKRGHLKKPNRIGARPPRQKSLAESVRSHLSFEVSLPQLPSLPNDISLIHTPPDEDLHHPRQRLSLLERLSDPVNQIDEQQPAQRHATASHHQTDNHGGIALGPEIARQVASNTSHINNETAPNARDLHASIPALLGFATQDSPCSKQQRPSSLHDGHQDDVGQAMSVPRTLTTPSSDGLPCTGTLASAHNDFDDSLASAVLEPSPVTQPQPLFRTHINNVLDKKEAHQGHVGSTPLAMTNHGPLIAAPIIAQGDQNLTKLRSDIRAKLLSRLGEEKKRISETLNSQNTNMGAKEVHGQHCDPPANTVNTVPTSEMDRNSPKYVTRADRSPRRSMRDCRDPDDDRGNSTPADMNVDSVALEARLRTRMKLRTKLSAEKKNGESK